MNHLVFFHLCFLVKSQGQSDSEKYFIHTAFNNYWPSWLQNAMMNQFPAIERVEFPASEDGYAFDLTKLNRHDYKNMLKLAHDYTYYVTCNQTNPDPVLLVHFRKLPDAVASFGLRLRFGETRVDVRRRTTRRELCPGVMRRFSDFGLEARSLLFVIVVPCNGTTVDRNAQAGLAKVGLLQFAELLQALF